jgi:hypothetical protein
MCKGRHTCLNEWVVFGESYQNANAAKPFGQLCVSGERPCRAAKNSDDEFAPFHAITSPARGTSRTVERFYNLG